MISYKALAKVLLVGQALAFRSVPRHLAPHGTVAMKRALVPASWQQHPRNPSSIGLGTTEQTQFFNVHPKQQNSTVTSAAALIAGTTIGGGFLALPYTTAPVGAVPATIGLLFAWLYLLLCSFELTTATFAVTRSLSDCDATFDATRPVSIYTIAKESLGYPAAVGTSFLFVILMMATLIAQLSKSNSLLGRFSWLGSGLAFGLPFGAAATLATSCTMAAVCFLLSSRYTERLNTALTAAMMASFAVILVSAKAAGWNYLGLAHADFWRLMPSPSRSSTWAIPVFMQLLVYAETIPIIAQRLGDEQKVKRSIVIGSSVPLLMCILWTCAALGCTYGHIPSTKAIITDPMDILLQGSSSGSMLSRAVFGLSLTAISTTIIGSFLALSQFIEDILCAVWPGKSRDDGPADGSRKKTTGLLKLLSRALAVLPPTIVAAWGSKSLYYACTAFAGEFPVTILWGLFPSLAVLKLQSQSKTGKYIREAMPRSTRLALIAIGATMVIINLVM